MDELHHECGIAAIYHYNPQGKSQIWSEDPLQISKLMPRMLLDLQNRGQLAAGMCSLNEKREHLLETYKDVGGVVEAFKMSHDHKFKAILEEYAGNAIIGHTRYATSGPTQKSYAQPFERKHGCKWKWYAFAFNGNLANYDQLREQILELKEYHLSRDNDTEVMMHLLSYALRGEQRPDLVKVFSELSQKLDGAYNLVFLNAMGDMVVVRDPLGLRPLCYANDGTVFAAASESVALQNLGFQEIHSLEPGQMILIQDGQFSIHRFAENRKTAHCFFEWIYFANVASTLDNRSVYLSRSRLGEELAKRERELGLVDVNDPDTIVVPVPDTGKAAADAMAYSLGVRSMEGLIRNRYVGRTFIEPGNRMDKVRLKFTPLREVLEGKTILLVEDSIVRSTTLRTLLGYLRDAGGVKKIHVRVACPPIVAPCFYGINMATITELYAPKFIRGDAPTQAELKMMADDLGADSLEYLPIEAVARCIDLPPQQLCSACLTRDYPTEHGQLRYELELVNGPQPQTGCGPASLPEANDSPLTTSRH